MCPACKASSTETVTIALARFVVSLAVPPSTRPSLVASAVEFLLEGLHLARRLNKDRIPGGTVYHR